MNSPFPATLAAVCCYFNPCHFQTRLSNYLVFREAMVRSSVELLTVELAFGDEPYELPPATDVLQLRGGDIMWQKCRLLQIGAERLVDEGFEAVALLDADIVFEDANWSSVVLRALERDPVVQCFGEVRAEFTDEVLRAESSIKRYRFTGELTGRTGYAWAMTSDVLMDVGLYQHGIIGGGDSLLFLGATGLANEEDNWDGRLSPHDVVVAASLPMRAHYRLWADQLVARTGGACGFADLAITALCHGARADRQYAVRHELLRNFDPVTEITCRPDGPFEWTQTGVTRRAAVERYFRRRAEDRDGTESAAGFKTNSCAHKAP